jgi:hypothetical protein
MNHKIVYKIAYVTRILLPNSSVAPAKRRKTRKIVPHTAYSLWPLEQIFECIELNTNLDTIICTLAQTSPRLALPAIIGATIETRAPASRRKLKVTLKWR